MTKMESLQTLGNMKFYLLGKKEGIPTAISGNRLKRRRDISETMIQRETLRSKQHFGMQLMKQCHGILVELGLTTDDNREDIAGRKHGTFRPVDSLRKRQGARSQPAPKPPKRRRTLAGFIKVALIPRTSSL